MDVITDTNALRGAGLDSPAIKALAEYLRRTRSTLFVPTVVREELLAQQRRNLQSVLHEFGSASKKLRKLVSDVALEVPTVNETEVVAILQRKLEELADSVEFVDYVAEDMPEMIRRLAGRIPPASSEGEEARDVLLWLITKRICSTRKVALVTNDRTFYQGDTLHPQLVTELVDAENSLEVFHEVNDLLRTHYARTSFVTEEWVDNQIDKDDFVSALDSFFDRRPDILDTSNEGIGESTGYSRVIMIVQRETRDFFVSDLDSDVVYVSATVWAELELEVEYYARNRDPYRNYLIEASHSSVIEYLYPCVEVHVQFEVRGETVERIVVSSIDLE
jgi:hypothetical protein